MRVLKSAECCGLKFLVCEDGFYVDLRDGNTKKFANGRHAVIVFSEEIASLVMCKLFAIIKGLGYNTLTGEKEVIKKEV